MNQWGENFFKFKNDKLSANTVLSLHDVLCLNSWPHNRVYMVGFKMHRNWTLDKQIIHKSPYKLSVLLNLCYEKKNLKNERFGGETTLLNFIFTR